ncbi:MAG: ketosteroid isomerase family protein [Mycobacteriaceae bacterium]|nr:ketosteroid isomerase family protein [Mycobacteriaceae bacterium]
MESCAEQLLAVVERSPQATAAHDRAGWVGLFTADGRIEDPVGARPHIGSAEIGRFYDTFIGPRDITFHRYADFVRGTVVIRDLELEVCMNSGVSMHIPAFLRYDLREVNGVWKIAALRAYWELSTMMWQFLRQGARAAPAAGQLALGLVRNQRLAGTFGFVTGFRPTGSRHKQLVQSFVTALVHGEVRAALNAMSPSATITLGDSDRLDGAELASALQGSSWTKLIAAGSTVTVALASNHSQAVICADLADQGNQIARVRYFPS